MNRPLSLQIKLILSWIIYLPIICTTYVAAWLDRVLNLSVGFPRDVEMLIERQSWLLHMLSENGVLPADAEIRSCEVTPLNQSIIFRSNAGIITITYFRKGEIMTLKCFAKFAPTMGTVWNRTIFNLQMNHIKEIWFNQYFVNQDNLPAPRVYLSRISEITGNLCLITEHMGDDIEYRECGYTSLPQEHLDLALDGLATLHARYWGDTSDRMKKVTHIDDMTVHLFDSIVSGSWSIPARKVLVRSWCLMNKPQTVLHGDSRIGNMMFPSAPDRGRFVLIDWQAVRKGTAAFDLAYFLILSLISTHREQVEQASIDTYYRLLVAKGVTGYTREQLEEDYKHACLCTLVLLSLPLLSGEASVEGLGAQIFAYGMGVWRERLVIRFRDFDYAWMSDRYGISEQDSRAAVAEMLTVIEKRLNTTIKASGTTETIPEILLRFNPDGAFGI